MTRKYTNKLLDLIDEGVITRTAVIEACLKYMSEDEVKDMCEMNMFFEDDDEDQDDVLGQPAPLARHQQVSQAVLSVDQLGEHDVSERQPEQVEIAEVGAFLDVITGGRFMLGVGLGYRTEEFAVFKVPMAERVSIDTGSKSVAMSGDDILDALRGVLQVVTVLDDGAERVKRRLRPRVHLLVRVTREETEFLAAHCVERTEHHDLLVQALLQHGIERRTQSKGALSRSRATAQRDNPDRGVEQHVDCESLFRAATVQSKHVPVTANEHQALLAGNATECTSALRVDNEVGVHRKVGDERADENLVLVQLGHVVSGQIDLARAGPPRVGRELSAVFLGGETYARRLDAQRQVLGHDHNVEPLLRQVECNREDSGVVVAQPQSRRKRRVRGVVQFDAQRTTVTDGDGHVESFVLDPKVIEESKSLTSEVADFRVIAFLLQLGDDDHGQNDLVFGESENRARIAEQNGCVEHIGSLPSGDFPG